MKTILVTVGSTSFQPLTDGIVSPGVLRRLSELGVRKLVIQQGSAPMPPVPESEVEVVRMRYTASPGEMDVLLREADGVISHAGSGTILAVLRMSPRVPLLVVPNSSLMDNHQQELADALEREGYLDVCDVSDLLTGIVRLLAATHLKPFPAPQPQRFASILDETAGFA